MRHGSLFSGIGGFDLAAEWMGWENVFHCEWNEFGQKVLKHYWPNAISYTDITKTDFTIHRGSIDVLTGGFPCQPFSQAGKRKGTADDRYLWPQMLRAIREVQPRFIVGENVSGLVNWDRGMVFEQVQADLENEGYESAAFILPAAGKDAPHQRDRIWFIAHAAGTGVQFNEAGIVYDINRNDKGKARTGKQQSGNTAVGESGDAADTNAQGLSKRIQPGEWKNPGKNGTRPGCEPSRTFATPGDWSQFPTVAPVCERNDGLSYGLSGITFSKWRQESIKAMGNAVCPQVVYEIFKAIQQTNDTGNNHRRE
jgi:DNA (cytosine-5)-methyltransferase 1